MNKSDAGRRGEQQALAYLVQHKGLLPVACNVKGIGNTEIDLILRDPQDGNALVFAEVKTRSRDPSPASAVDRRKQAKLCKAALSYLMENDLMQAHVRFDVVEVFHQGGEWAFNHIQDAFKFTPGRYFA